MTEEQKAGAKYGISEMLVVANVLRLYVTHLREFGIYMGGGMIEAAEERIHSLMVEFPLQAEEQCTYSKRCQRNLEWSSGISSLHPETVSTSLRCEY